MQVFVQRILSFGYEHFLTVLMGNNNKMIENDVRKISLQKLVIVCMFATFECFHSKSSNFMLRVQNHVILASFPTYLPLVFFVLEKTIEILTLTFF